MKLIVACMNKEVPSKVLVLKAVCKLKKCPAITNNMAQLLIKSNPTLRVWHGFCPP